MAYRLVMTISDVVRRATHKRLTGREEELGEDADAMAPGWSADQLRGHLGDDVLAALKQGADWPQMARPLVGLQQARVDLGMFLPQMGRMTAAVHQAGERDLACRIGALLQPCSRLLPGFENLTPAVVTANIARIKAEGTHRWADLLRTTMPQGLVRDAVLASPAWPDIAAAMGRLDAAGIDVAPILADAHRAGVGVDQAVAAADSPRGCTGPYARSWPPGRTGCGPWRSLGHRAGPPGALPDRLNALLARLEAAPGCVPHALAGAPSAGGGCDLLPVLDDLRPRALRCGRAGGRHCSSGQRTPPQTTRDG
ncbi:hypothetical protein [Streptomyces sp. 3211]|uniref:hypothetical protein n=1 Tax=Streptomyces sp. 3211 TaxID=1964449 RepID=UPI0009A51D3F|nr:hypothetical protein [Streptomyces sp. 3211]